MGSTARRQKLLSNYISKKLKKDQRKVLFDRLEKSCVDMDSLVSFKGTKKKATKHPKFRASRGSESLCAIEISEPCESISDTISDPEGESGDTFRIPNIQMTATFPGDILQIPQQETRISQPIISQSISLGSCNSKDTIIALIRQRHDSERAFSCTIQRNEEIQLERMKLPIFGEEQTIMDAVHNNGIVIICGETGSGKTTQLPQFLHESGYGSTECPHKKGIVGITQPRRIAAISMSKRVADELGPVGHVVGYRVRYDSTINPDTKILFMTDGILLREISSDFLLTKYSVIILDEVHERNVNTDILMGLLGRIVAYREKLFVDYWTSHLDNPGPGDPPQLLKLIVMSATLNVEEFLKNDRLFPPSLLFPSRDPHPPVIEISSRQYPVTIHFNRQTPTDYMDEAFKKVVKIHRKLSPGNILVFVTGEDEVRQLVKRLDDMGLSMAVLPLFSLLSPEEQLRVFDPLPDTRTCIVSTNVAETSITIPGIVYVVDTGKVKIKMLDRSGSVEKFEIEWISKSSATQRAGRAGRLGPGHCYRLYSAAVYNDVFEENVVPEISRIPLHSLVLQMKSMNIDNVCDFPFPTPVSTESLRESESLLIMLEALECQTCKNHRSRPVTVITSVGKKMALFPLDPRLSKMILLATKEPLVIGHVVVLVAVLSVGDPFDGHANAREVRQQFSDRHITSDLVSMVNVFREYIRCTPHERIQFCNTHGLRLKTLQEIEQLHNQIVSILEQRFEINSTVTANLRALETKPTQCHWRLVIQCFLNTHSDRLARLCSDGVDQESGQKGNGYHILELLGNRDVSEPVWSRYQLSSKGMGKVSPKSVIFKKKLPGWVVYRNIRLKKRNGHSMLMLKMCTKIDETWIPQHCHRLCKWTGLVSPPNYDHQLDQMFGYSVPSVAGIWNLPPTLVNISLALDDIEKFKWFGKLLLDGEICDELKPYAEKVVKSTSIIVKQYSTNQAVELWLALAKHQVDSRAKLCSRWQFDRTYLLKQVLSWYPTEVGLQIQTLWPPLKQS